MTFVSPIRIRRLASRIVAPRSDADRVVLTYGLHAQRRLFAYMIGFTGIGIPMFLWAAHYSIDGWPYFAYAGTIALNAIFFLWLAARSSTKEEPADDEFHPPKLEEALWRQGLGAGLWTVTLLVICLSAAVIGHKPQLLLMICAGAAVGIIFFSSPVQTFLLTLGPIAMAGPIIATRYLAPDSELSNMISAGLILALAMGFVVNRHLKDHYDLRHRQALLNQERERSQKSTEILHQSRAALMDTLSRDVQSGLGALEASLNRGLNFLTRAPAPRQEVHVALAEVIRLKELITTTLDNGILEAGTLHVAMAPLDITSILNDLSVQFAPVAQMRGLSLHLDLHGVPKSGAAIGDAQRVHQILSHLIKNAIDYSARGTIEIKAQLIQNHLCVFVIDTGAGLSPDELHEAFLPYRRILRTCAGHAGAGLGLSLSKALAELMEARLKGESTRDVGSKFWLELKFDPDANAPTIEAAPIEAPSISISQRVLLLSNDSLRAAQLRQWLEQQGHLCLLSTKVERALTLMQKSPFDAIVISHDSVDEVSDSNAEINHLIDGLNGRTSEARTKIIALLDSGLHCQELEAKGVSPLIWPTSKVALTKALEA